MLDQYDIIICFRPLDGESFSKRYSYLFFFIVILHYSFRPLDGESFSKRRME